MVEEVKEAKLEVNDPIARAEAVVNAMKAENDRAEKLLEERKAVEARLILGGKSGIGNQEAPKVETEHEKWAREAKIRYKGTGICPV